MPYSNYIVSALWDTKTKSLYMANCVTTPQQQNSIFRYDYASGMIYGASIVGEESAGFIIPVEGDDNLFVAGLDGDVKVINWDRKSALATVNRTLFTAKGQFYSATTDRKGRLYTGNINFTTLCTAPDEYAVYRFADGELTTLFNGIQMTNGIAIDEQRGKLYHVNACIGQIVQFDYDCKTGDICRIY